MQARAQAVKRPGVPRATHEQKKEFSKVTTILGKTLAPLTDKALAPSGAVMSIVHLQATTILLVSSLGTLMGCAAHHVQLYAPEPDAPVEERRTAYAHLQPVSITETHITTFNKWGSPIGAKRRTEHLQLRGGERVSEPEDLWPVIAQTSASANAVTRYEENMSSLRTATWLASAFLAAGLGMTGYSVFHRNSDGTRNALWLTEAWLKNLHNAAA